MTSDWRSTQQYEFRPGGFTGSSSTALAAARTASTNAQSAGVIRPPGLFVTSACHSSSTAAAFSRAFGSESNVIASTIEWFLQGNTQHPATLRTTLLISP